MGKICHFYTTTTILLVICKCFAYIKNLKLIARNDVTKVNEFPPIRHFFLFWCCSLLGVDKVIQYAVTEWITDIRKNQLPGILGGVGPMHSVVQLCEFKLPNYYNSWIVVNPILYFCLFVQFMESEICSGCLLNSTERMDALFEVSRGEQHPLAPLQRLLPWSSATGWFRPYRCRLFRVYLYPQKIYN